MQEYYRKVFSLVLQPSHKFMLEAGVSAADLLAGTDISEADLASPYQLLDAQQARRYYLNIVEHAPTPSIGLAIGNLSNLTNLGTYGLMSLAADNIKEATILGRKNADLIYMHLTWVTRIGRGSVIHNFVCQELDPKLRVFLLERAMVSFQRLASIQIGDECRPTSVSLDYPDPGYTQEYREIFGDVVQFDQPVPELRYPKRFEAAPLRTSNPVVRDTLLVLCEDLRQRMQSDSSFVADLRFVINEQPGVFLKISDAAKKIGMSPRNLRRKLQQEGASYQKIVDDLRCAIAVDNLKTSDLSIQEIARQCGFNSPQNFANAFKRWTGRSPTEYRAQRETDNDAG
jgi:AraC-like DNA-binding protein